MTDAAWKSEYPSAGNPDLLTFLIVLSPGQYLLSTPCHFLFGSFLLGIQVVSPCQPVSRTLARSGQRRQSTVNSLL